MDITIRQIEKKDFNKARKFAIDGMNLSWYTSNDIELYIYSKYFWYLEISRATRALGAYSDNELIGVLLIDMKNKPKLFTSLWKKIFITAIHFFINLGYRNASSTYDNANKQMLSEFEKENQPDGELNFFAVNPNIKGHGIGTLLLNELERLEKGKLIYLYTDTGSTYQFYLHRNFIESGRRETSLKIHKNELPLTCFLFSKRL